MTVHRRSPPPPITRRTHCFMAHPAAPSAIEARATRTNVTHIHSRFGKFASS